MYICVRYRCVYDVQNRRFCYCSPLMSRVALELSKIKNYKVSAALHHSRSGTAATEAYLDPCSTNEEFNRLRMYCDSVGRVASHSKLDVRLANAMRVMGYCIKKNNLNDEACWACYDFNHYRDVPVGWINNRNQVFFVGLETLSIADKFNVIADRDVYRRKFLQSAIIERSRD